MASPQPVSFAALLRRFRRAAGLTQEEFAEKAGVSVGAIGALERGLSHIPQRGTLELLIDALGLTSIERAQLEQAARSARASSTQRAPQLATGTALPIVGRRQELAVITHHLAGQGEPLLLLAGEPGIGKSRLLREAVAQASAAGWATLEGGCNRRSGQAPYAPLVSAFQNHLRTLSGRRLRTALEGCAWLVRLLPELAERTLAPLPTWAISVEQERRLMFEAAGRYLAHVAESTGALLALDDVQWAGPDALDLLGMLARGAAGANVRIIAAYRSTEVRAADTLGVLQADLAREELASLLTLGPLDPDAASALLDALLPEDDVSDAPLREQALARSEGVPFFLVSCAQELRQQRGDAEAVSEGQSTQRRLSIPWSVAQSIHQRIALLTEPTQALLGVAAVAGRVVSAQTLLLASQAHEDQVLAQLAEACASGLLVEDIGEVYRFAHDLIRETALTDLSAAQRSAYHRRVAESLERQPDAEQRAAELAWHFIRGRRPEQAAVYLERAASQAQEMYAYSEAERSLRDLITCLEALGRPLQAAHARERLGVVLRTMAHYDEAMAALDAAISAYQQAGASEEAARALAHLGLTYANRGLSADGAARLQSYLGLPSTKTLSPQARASLYLALTQLRKTGGRYKEMLAAAEAAGAQAALADDSKLRARAAQERGTALLMLGRNVEGERTLEAALQDIEALDDPVALARALNNLSVAHEGRGDFAIAREYLDRAVAQATRSADPVLTAFMTYRRATNSYDSGLWVSAHADYGQALAALRPVGQSWALPYALRGFGMLELALGNTETALAALEQGRAAAEALGDMQVRQNIQIALSEADLLADRPLVVIERLGTLLDTAEQEGDVFNILCPLALAYAALGDTDRAAELVERAMLVAREEQSDLGLAEALRARALTLARRRKWQAAEKAGLEALTLYHELDVPYGEIKAHYCLGKVHQAWGKRAQSQEHFESALAICQRLGERLYGAQVERLLAALDESVSLD